MYRAYFHTGFERDANGALLVKTGNKPKQRNKKKAKKETSRESGKEKVDQEANIVTTSTSTQASTTTNPPLINKTKKGRGSH